MVFQSFFMLIISIQPDYAAYCASGRAGGANPKVSAQLELSKPAPQTVMNKD
jgi:hypothetical protein